MEKFPDLAAAPPPVQSPPMVASIVRPRNEQTQTWQHPVYPEDDRTVDAAANSRVTRRAWCLPPCETRKLAFPLQVPMGLS